MEGTSARLRKTFHYPTDGDSEDDLPSALDEEEQDNLIQTLKAENETRNKQYSRVLLLLPIATILPYLRSLFTSQLTLLSLLSITSLLSTTHLLYSLPPGVTSITFLDNLNNPLELESQAQRRFRTTEDIVRKDRPVALYLPYLNIGICLVLVVLGSLVGRKTELWVGFQWLPAAVQVVVLVAKWVMGSVDPEGELGTLRYGYKGA